MLKATLENYTEVNRSFLFGLRIREDVKMYTQSPGYDDLHGFDLSIDIELEAISQRIAV